MKGRDPSRAGAAARGRRHGDGGENHLVSELLGCLAEIGTTEVKSAGKFTPPGLVTIKARMEPARQAPSRRHF